VPTFSHISTARLNTCHRDLITLATHVVERIDCTVVTGHRAEAEQNIAHSTGHSGLAWPDSKHNSYPSMAIDLAPYAKGIPWEDAHAFYLFAGKVSEIAHQLYESGDMTHKLRLGADWDNDQITTDQRLADPGHFELVP
jgi:peptidoglycan L-alanyl-D-glutamate endopeptidase CwlK